MRFPLKVLSPDEIAQIHEHSLKILSSIGVQIGSPGIAARLGEIARQKTGEDVFYFDREIVEWAIDNAPRVVKVEGRAGDAELRLGSVQDRRTHFGIGVTNLYYQDPASHEIMPFTRELMRIAVRLGQFLPAYDFVSTPGVLQDQPPGLADLYACLEMAANTTKPMILLISNKDSFSASLDLIESLQGSLKGIIPYFNPQTPLVFPAGVLENMQAAIERELPIILSNYGMLGASTPASLVGTLSVLNAELLAGLVLAQWLRPGTPVILGSLPAIFDMRSSMSYYSAHSFLIDLVVVDMLKHYGIPTCGTSGCEGGWGMDLRASGELWFNHVLSILAQVDLVPFVGSTFNSQVFSPELVVYARVLIKQLRQFTSGLDIQLDEDFLQEIQAAGPGGHFLASEMTLKNFRKFITPDIFPRISLEDWQKDGSPDMQSMLQEHTRTMIADLQPLEGNEELMRKGEEFIRRLQVK
jgi:trimethylamine--corrinoid protein Co-methyltransferase